MPRSDWRRPDLPPLAEGKRRIALKVAYNGGLFCGWQRQQNGDSVEALIEDAVFRMIGEEVVAEGSGRTDSGVHAAGQVCHFDISNMSVPPEVFKTALNCLLPNSIRILESAQKDGSFHSRYTAMAREYRYFIKDESSFTPFDDGFVWRVRTLPPLELLNSYAAEVRGTHDFTSFCGIQDLCPSKMRDIYVSEFSMEGDRLVYRICGNAFLYHMVRSLVGTMVVFAQKELSVDTFRNLLEAKEHTAASFTAPPAGLYLWEICFDTDRYPDSMLERK